MSGDYPEERAEVSRILNSWQLAKELKKRAEIFRKLDAETKNSNETMLISKEILTLSRKFYTLVEELYEIGRQIKEEGSLRAQG